MNTGVRRADPDWVVAFVNEYGTLPRRAAGEEGYPYPPLDALGEHDRASSASLSREQLVALADRLHRVFSSSSRSEAAVALNELLEDSCPTPRLHANEDGGYETSWSVRETADAPLAAACALAFLGVLTGPWGFGTCDAARCADVFVDRSPGGQRKYCSTQCHTRTKVASFRRRRAERAETENARVPRSVVTTCRAGSSGLGPSSASPPPFEAR